jgi:diaminopimelate decarboxylase
MKQTWEIKGYREVVHGRLAIDGVDAVQLVRDQGSPLFVFSESRIRSNVQRLLNQAQAAHPRVKLCYAGKANSNIGVLRVVREAGGDLEINSGGELFKAIKAGFDPNQIVFNGVSKTMEELEQAISFGIYTINLDSPYELDLVMEAARRVGKTARVAIRLVPEIETQTHAGLQTALYTSKFGVSPGQVLDCFRRALDHPDVIELTGIHIHVGSQTPDIEPYVQAFTTMWMFVTKLFRQTGHRLKHVNVGGGVPVRYVHDEAQANQIRSQERAMLSAQLDLKGALVAALAAARESTNQPEERALLDQIEIVLEPGRSVIADTGTLLTTVRNVKFRPETQETWLLTDAGYELLLSMSNYKWYYHLISAERAGQAHHTKYKVAGPLCDGGDVYFDIEGKGRLPEHRLLPEHMQPGEVLALLDAGAYTLAQLSQYNGRPSPAVVMVRPNGEVQLVRRRESYDDLISQDVW